MARIMDLYSDVHAFEITALGQVIGDAFLEFEMNGGLQGNAAGSLNGIEAYNQVMGDGISNGYGITRRVIKQSQYIADEGEQQPPREQTTVCGDYPVHTFTNGQVSVEIDFGKTVNVLGQFYPFIRIELSNGMGSARGALVQGSLDFAGIGPIPIYGPAFGYFFGSIKISERYSDIAMSKFTADTETQVTFQARATKKFSGFQNVTDVFIGNSKAQFQKSNTSITVTVPADAESNFVTFIANGNKFYSPEVLRITKPV